MHGLNKQINQILIMFTSLVFSRGIIGYLWYSSYGTYQELDFVSYFVYSIINASIDLVPLFIILKLSTRLAYLKLKDSVWLIIMSTATYTLTFVIFERDYLKLINIFQNMVTNSTYLLALVATTSTYYFLILLFYGFIYNLIKRGKK